MSKIQNIFVEYAPAYLDRFGYKMPENHKKVISDIIACRTQAFGKTVYECTECGAIHHFYRSCGNRHCPGCQHLKALEWNERQSERVLPGHHFMATFTVPEQLRPFIRSHQKDGYGGIFKASSDTLKKLSQDEKYIGGDQPGFFGVLHTGGRTMHYHPHVHYVVPGGAVSSDDGLWHPSRTDFYLPVKALSKVYKAKFRDIMIKEGLFDQIPAEVWSIDWNVNVQAVGNAENTIKYLSRYVFHVAISDYRIVKVENCMVTFKYRKQGSSRDRCMTLDAMEFIRRFLQHVLPSGFMKVRYYGFLNPNSTVKIDRVQGLIELYYEFEIRTPEITAEPVKPLYCPDCGGKLKYLCSVLPFEMIPVQDTG
jgi:hypothetical protein